MSICETVKQSMSLQRGIDVLRKGVAKMVKYAYAERVVKKLKKLLSMDMRFADMLKSQPAIAVGSDFCLESVVWTYYDYSLICTARGVIFQNRNSQSTILTYAGFDAFLSM